MTYTYAVPASPGLARATKKGFRVIEDSKYRYMAEIDPHAREIENKHLAGFSGLEPIVVSLTELLSKKGVKVQVIRSDESGYTTLNAVYFAITNGNGGYDVNNSLMAIISGDNSATRLTLRAKGDPTNLPALRGVAKAYKRQL